jgi:hypothetical protein
MEIKELKNPLGEISNTDVVPLNEFDELEEFGSLMGKVKKVGQVIGRGVLAIHTFGASEVAIRLKDKYDRDEKKRKEKEKAEKERIDKIMNSMSEADKEVLRERLSGDELVAMDAYKELIKKYGKSDADKIVKRLDVPFKPPKSEKEYREKATPEDSQASQLYSSMSSEDKKQIKEASKDPNQFQQILMSFAQQFGAPVAIKLLEKIGVKVPEDIKKRLLGSGGGGQPPQAQFNQPESGGSGSGFMKYLPYVGIGLVGLFIVSRVMKR